MSKSLYLCSVLCICFVALFAPLYYVVDVLCRSVLMLPVH